MTFTRTWDRWRQRWEGARHGGARAAFLGPAIPTPRQWAALRHAVVDAHFHFTVAAALHRWRRCAARAALGSERAIAARELVLADLAARPKHQAGEELPLAWWRPNQSPMAA